MFFSLFPTLQYDEAFLVDLSRRLQEVELDDPKFLYDEYVIQNGERPDALSTKFYGVPYYHWVILATNQLTLRTWPKSDSRFDLYISEKYDPQGEYETAQWIDSEGRQVPYVFPASIVDQDGNTQNFWFNGDGLGVVQGNDVYSVGGSTRTYLDVEREANDQNSKIRILSKSFLGQVTDLARALLSK